MLGQRLVGELGEGILTLGGLEAWSKTAGIAGTDLSHPNLRVRMPGKEPIRGCHLVPVYFVIGGLDVDERILPFIPGTEDREHLALVDFVAALGDLFSTVSSLL
jgi:hypothetical protein